MSWIKNTGSPSTGHPFSSLNPEAVEFVPRLGNTTAPSEESPCLVVPAPFSKPEITVEATSADCEDRVAVGSSLSENSLPHQPYITEQPITTNMYQEKPAADKPESYCTEENSTNQNDVADCQTVEESFNDDELVHSDEQLPSHIEQEEQPHHLLEHSDEQLPSRIEEEEQPHHSSEPHSDQNFRNRNNFRDRGYPRRSGRGNFRGRYPRGKPFTDNHYQRSGPRWHDANNVHLSSDKTHMNEESSYEPHAWERRESSSRNRSDAQGPRQHEQDWREKRSRDGQPYRNNERGYGRRTFPNDKPRRENNSAETDWNKSQDPRETTMDNRGRGRGTNPRLRDGNPWRNKHDQPRYGVRHDRRNANSSEDELKVSHDDNYHITDDDSNNAWDLDEKQHNARQPASTKSENVENSSSWIDAIDLERSQCSSIANTLEKQDKNSLTNYNNDDPKENFNKPPKFNNRHQTRTNHKQKQDKRFSESRKTFDEDDTKDLPEGTNLMDKLISEETSRRSEISRDSHSKAEEESSDKQHENFERRQESSRGRGRSNPRRDEQNWREKRNRDDEPYRNYQRQNRQRTSSDDKHERQNNDEYDSNNSRDGRVARRGAYSDSRGYNQRGGKSDRPKFDKARDGGRQDRLSPGLNNQKDVNYSEDDLKITHDESSCDTYHITDDDSSNACDMDVEQQSDLTKPGNVENSTSWNDDIDNEMSQSSSVSNTVDTQENYTLANDDRKKEPLPKSSRSNNKSDKSSQKLNKPDSPSKHNTQNLDEKGKPKSKGQLKQSEKPSDSRRSLNDNNGDDSVTSNTKFRKSFPEENNDTVAKRSKQFTETQKLLDPRMEREKINKSCGSIVAAEDESDRKKITRHSEGNQRRITSYFEPGGNRESFDKEFDLWDKRCESIKEFKRVVEVTGDLFEQPKEYSLAHCVAEDLRMGSGIAVAFKREFKNLPDLLDQRAKQGGLATLHDEDNNRYVYYLVTKRESTGKPTYFTLWKSLYKMREHVKEHEVKKIAIPRLACGLDRLEWNKVKSMLESLFKDVDVEIRVCNFQQNEITEEKKSKTCKLVVEEFPVTKIGTGTLILYLATSDGEQDDIIRNLSKKFNFWPSFQVCKTKNLGDIVYYDDKGQNFGLCGCIVRRTSKEEINFKSLHMCIQNFNKKNKQFGNDMFEYVAFQWVDEKAYYDDLINQKIITLLIGFLRNVEVYVCKGSFGDEGE